MSKNPNTVRRVIRLHGLPQDRIEGDWLTKLNVGVVVFLTLFLPLASMFLVGLSAVVTGEHVELTVGFLCLTGCLYGYLFFRLHTLFHQFFLRSMALMFQTLFIQYMIERDEGFEEFYHKMHKEFSEEMKKSFSDAKENSRA